MFLSRDILRGFMRKFIYTLRIDIMYWLQHKSSLGLFYTVKPPSQLRGFYCFQKFFKCSTHSLVNAMVVGVWEL